MLKYIISIILFFFSFYAFGNDFSYYSNKNYTITGKEVSKFNKPWSMIFLDTKKILVTTMEGNLWLLGTNGKKIKIQNVPKTFYGGQGGLGDIAIDLDFKNNSKIFFSIVESSDGGKTRGSSLYSAKLLFSPSPILTEIKCIWKQFPRVEGLGHFSQKIVIPPSNSVHRDKIFITSGDRRKSELVQNLKNSLGKIIRINIDGTTPKDNPFEYKYARNIWTLGHRNILGIAFDKNGNLWVSEMGPKHGDEFNLIKKGKNYGWPRVSEGNHYDGRLIPKHKSNKLFLPPVISWTPSIAPSSFIIYQGNQFSGWKNKAVLATLKGESLIIINLQEPIKEIERVFIGARVRDVKQSPNGEIWILTDGINGALIKLNKKL